MTIDVDDSDEEIKVAKKQNNSAQSSIDSEETQKEPLSDVWIFDTFKCTWSQIDPQLQIQGSTAGKKIRKFFEPRLAHTAVIIDSYVVVFGGLNSNKNSLISNDIYVLCLDNKV